MTCRDIITELITEFKDYDINVTLVEGCGIECYEEWDRNICLPNLNATDWMSLRVAVHETMHAIRHQVWVVDIYENNCVDEDALAQEEWEVETRALNFIEHLMPRKEFAKIQLLTYNEGHKDIGTFEKFKMDCIRNNFRF